MKPPRIFLITDTHFNHDAMIELCGRPANHTQLILDNWRKAVTDNDITFHLGDVILNRPSELQAMMAQIPGKKILIRGNHDGNKPHWYMNRGFDFACDAMVWGDIYFTHVPAESLPPGCTVNIHGHLHNSGHRDVPIQPFHKLLAIELTDYKPVLLDDFRTSLKDEGYLPQEA